MNSEDNPYFLMGAMLGAKCGEVTDLRRRIEELEAENAKLKQMWWDAGDVTDLAGTIADLQAKLVQQDDDDFHPASAGDDPIWLGGVEYITKSRSDDLVQAAVERGFWAGRSCGGSKVEIDAALAAIREGGE